LKEGIKVKKIVIRIRKEGNGKILEASIEGKGSS